VLSKINNIFSDRHINIASQYLQTNDKVGYVVVDINSPYDEVALEQLKNIEGTISCRVLF
jgi:D-3-phosphoglycerate dehydrogenase